MATGVYKPRWSLLNDDDEEQQAAAIAREKAREEAQRQANIQADRSLSMEDETDTQVVPEPDREVAEVPPAAPTRGWSLLNDPDNEAGSEELLASEYVPEPPPRDTTFGEKIKGGALAAGSSTMGATSGLVHLIDAVLPKPLEPYITDPWIDFFDKGQAAAQALKPKAFQDKVPQGFLDISDEGKVVGVQLPSPEHAINFIAETLAYIPSFLTVGGATGSAIKAGIPTVARTGKVPILSDAAKKAADKIDDLAEIVGYGIGNASLIAPVQYEETYTEAIKEGKTEQEARQAALFAGNLTAALTIITGSTGAYLGMEAGRHAASTLGAIIRGFVTGGPLSEGPEEFGQSVIADAALGKDIDWVAASDVGASASVLGGSTEGTLGGITHAASRREADALPELPEVDPPDTPPPRDPNDPDLAPLLEDTPALQAAKESLDLNDPLHDRIDAARGDTAADPLQPESLEEIKAELQTPVTVPDGAELGSPVTVPDTQEQLSPEPVQQTLDLEEPASVVESAPEANPNLVRDPGDMTGHDPARPRPQAPQPAPFDARRATPEERTERQRKVRSGEIAVDPKVKLRAFKSGNKAQAIELQDGTWLLRTKENYLAKWSKWEPRESIDTINMTPYSTDSGIINVPGKGSFRVGERIDADTSTNRGPPDLLQELAAGRKLNRRAFAEQLGLDPADTRNLRPIPGQFDSPFSDKGGMTPEELLVWLKENGYINEESAVRPDEATINDAYEILSDALSGGRVVSQEYSQQEGAYQAEQRYLQEQGQQDSEAERVAQDREAEMLAGADDALAINGTDGPQEGTPVPGPAANTELDAFLAAHSSIPIPETAWSFVLNDPRASHKDGGGWSIPGRNSSMGKVDYNDRGGADGTMPSVDVVWTSPSGKKGGVYRVWQDGQVTRPDQKPGDSKRPIPKWLINSAVEQMDGITVPQTPAVEGTLEPVGAPRVAKGTQIADVPNVDAIVTGIAKGMGEHYSSLVTLVDESHPDATNAEGEKMQGFYDPNTGKSHLVVSPGLTVPKALWVSWHEVFHKGFDNFFNPRSTESKLTPESDGAAFEAEAADFEKRKQAFFKTLKLAGANRIVNKIATALADKYKYGRSRSIEEALVEIGAAIATKDYKEISRKYGIDLPKEMRTGKQGTLRKLVAAIAKHWRELWGKAQPEIKEFSDKQIFDLLKSFKRESLKPQANIDPSVRLRTQRTDSVLASRKETDVPTSTRIDDAGMNERREASGLPPVETSETTDFERIKEQARAILKEDPLQGEFIQTQILGSINYLPSVQELAVLHQHLHQQMLSADLLGDKAGAANLTDEVRADLTSKWNLERVKVDETEQAIRIASGRLGRSFRYLRETLEDQFSEAALVRRLNIVHKGEIPAPILTRAKEVAAELKKQAVAIEERKTAEETALGETEFDQLVHALKQAVEGTGPAKSISKPTPKTMAKWKESVENSRKVLRAALFDTNAIRPELMRHIANIGAYEMARGGSDIATWLKAFKANVGADAFAKLEPDIQDIYQESRTLHESTRANRAEAVASLKAHAAAGDPLSHTNIYTLAKAHVESGEIKATDGVSFADAIMAAVLQDVRAAMPEVTERDIRQAFVEYGKFVRPTQDEIKLQMQEITQIVRIGEHIEKLKEGKDALKRGSRGKDTDAVKEAKQQLAKAIRVYEHNHPHEAENRLLGVNERRETALRNRIRQVKDLLAGGKGKEAPVPVPDSAQVASLRLELEALQDKLAHQVHANKADPQVYEQQVQGRLRRQMRSLQRRLDNKDYRLKPKKPHQVLSKETMDLQFEHDELKAKYLLELYKQERAKWPAYKKFGHNIVETSAVMRGVKTSWDTMTFRQGGMSIAAHPQLLSIALKAQVAAALSERKAYQLDHDIINSLEGAEMRRVGLFFNDPHSTRYEKQDEAFMSEKLTRSPLAKWTGVAQSARAYNTGLNVLRYEYFRMLRDKLTVNGTPLTEAELRHLAYWVNRSTGRGEIGKGGGGDIAGALLFFAPRWVQSRFSILSMWPLISSSVVSRRMFGLIAKEYGKSISGLIALNVLVAAAFAAAGGDDPLDPDEWNIGTDMSSSDFWKVVVGNTRVDQAAGLAQQMVFMYRLVSGTTTDGLGKTTDWRGPNATTEQSRMEGITMRYLRSKLSPGASLIWNSVDRKDFMGQDTNFVRELFMLPIPLPLAGILSGEIQEAHDIGATISLQLLQFLGSGATVYTNTGGGKSSTYGQSAADIYGESAMYEGSSKGLFGDN